MTDFTKQYEMLLNEAWREFARLMNIELEKFVDTFGHWAYALTDRPLSDDWPARLDEFLAQTERETDISVEPASVPVLRDWIGALARARGTLPREAGVHYPEDDWVKFIYSAAAGQNPVELAAADTKEKQPPATRTPVPENSHLVGAGPIYIGGPRPKTVQQLGSTSNYADVTVEKGSDVAFFNLFWLLPWFAGLGSDLINDSQVAVRISVDGNVITAQTLDKHQLVGVRQWRFQVEEVDGTQRAGFSVTIETESYDRARTDENMIGLRLAGESAQLKVWEAYLKNILDYYQKKYGAVFTGTLKDLTGYGEWKGWKPNPWGPQEQYVPPAPPLIPPRTPPLGGQLY